LTGQVGQRGELQTAKMTIVSHGVL
jgi:hypothetical protein